MATRSYLALPPVAAVFGCLFLLLPTGLLAQVTAGSFADCINLVDVEFSSYLAVEETFTSSGCIRRQGDAYIVREGVNGTDVVKFLAFAEMKQCWVQDETSVVGTIFGLSGGDVAAWKKYLLNEGCDMVNYVAPDERIIFVTSQSFTGDLIGAAKNLGFKGRIRSGLEAADKICTKLANDAGLPGETYTAWLSDSTTSARDRVVHSEVPYVLVTGEQIVDSYATLITAGTDCGFQPCLDRPIGTDENGTAVPAGYRFVWTSTYASGVGLGPTLTADICQDWTATTSMAGAGAAEFRNRQWTDNSDRSCSLTSRLYCFQD